MTIRLGLCSVTFRSLEPAHIARIAAASGLESIEWGGDVHAPAGDIAQARRVAAVTADAGLAVASYGSYFRADGDDIAPVLDSAQVLGAHRIRVWAGRLGSDQAEAAHRLRTVDTLRAAADAASDRGLTLSVEYHGDTLADTPEATLRLLAEVDHPALGTYWQPTVGARDADAVAEYRALADRVAAVHVFSWWPQRERLPLAGRARLWQEFFAAASSHPAPPTDALIEFVPGDDPDVLAREAETLRRFRDGAPLGSGS